MQLGQVQMDNDAYHAADGISCSHLKDVEAGERHYWHKRINPNREPEAQDPGAKLLGSATHCAILEPDFLTSRYVSVPEDAPKRPTSTQLAAAKPSAATLEQIAWWQDFEAQAAGKEILPFEAWKNCIGMRDAVLAHPVASKLLADIQTEQTFFAIDPETGTLIKSRPDAMNARRGLMVDVKSARDASPDGFGKQAANLRYDLQPPWYQDVVKAAIGESLPIWAFVAVESTAPYCIGVYYVEEGDIHASRADARRLLNKILACRASGVWPDYTWDKALPLKLPAWHRR